MKTSLLVVGILLLSTILGYCLYLLFTPNNTLLAPNSQGNFTTTIPSNGSSSAGGSMFQTQSFNPKNVIIEK